MTDTMLLLIGLDGHRSAECHRALKNQGEDNDKLEHVPPHRSSVKRLSEIGQSAWLNSRPDEPAVLPSPQRFFSYRVGIGSAGSSMIRTRSFAHFGNIKRRP